MTAAAGGSQADTPTRHRRICVDTLPSAGDEWESTPAANRERGAGVCG